MRRHPGAIDILGGQGADREKDTLAGVVLDEVFDDPTCPAPAAAVPNREDLFHPLREATQLDPVATKAMDRAVADGNKAAQARREYQKMMATLDLKQCPCIQGSGRADDGRGGDRRSGL